MRKIFFFFILILFSCKDYGNPVNLEESTSYTYSGNIKPIFDENCISCHGPVNQYGNLRLDSYQEVIKSGTISSDDPSTSSLYDRITRLESEQGDMPPAGFLSSSNIDLIYEWINDEALE
jgi:mono/diheme cytochrome c family protein